MKSLDSSLLVSWDGKNPDDSSRDAPLWKYPLQTPRECIAVRKNEPRRGIQGDYLMVKDSCLPGAGMGLFARYDISANSFLDTYGTLYIAEPCDDKHPKRKTYDVTIEKYIVNLPKQRLLLEHHNPDDSHGNLFHMVIEKNHIIW